MKQLVRMQVTPEASREIEARQGGAGPAIAGFVARFAPETYFVSPKRREIFMVCDLSPADLTELAVAGTQFAGREPDLVPVVPGDEFCGMLAQGVCPVRGS